jgi:arginyl-tRNA synthetase
LIYINDCLTLDRNSANRYAVDHMDPNMDIFSEFSQRVNNALLAAFPDEKGLADLLARVVVEPPRDTSHGDMSTNAAMVVAKLLGQKPRDIAETLVAHFEEDADVSSVEVAGPWFIFLRVANDFWQRVLKSVGARGAEFGRSDIGQGAKVNIEYVSTNPTGPMHVGHTRGAVYGDALASLMDYCGFDVMREYYVNDAGGQVDVLAKSAFLRYREALGEDIGVIPEGLYPGDYLVPIGKTLAQEFGDELLKKPEKEWLEIARPKVLAAMLDLIKADLAKLDIVHDTFFSEKTLHGPDGDIATTLKWLTKAGLVYTGRLEPPKGKTPEDWEDREQTRQNLATIPTGR